MLGTRPSSRLNRPLIGSLILVCAAVVLLAPWHPAYAEKEADQSKPAPAYHYEDVAKSVMQKHKVPYYKLSVGGLMENGDEYAPSLFMAKGISTTMSIGADANHVFRVGAREGNKVKLTCMWEHRVSEPKSIDGQRLWTSSFTAFESDVQLGSSTTVELVSPTDTKVRKRLTVSIEPHKAAQK